MDAFYTPSIRESKTPKEENSSGLSYFLNISSDKLGAGDYFCLPICKSRLGLILTLTL